MSNIFKSADKGNDAFSAIDREMSPSKCYSVARDIRVWFSWDDCKLFKSAGLHTKNPWRDIHLVMGPSRKMCPNSFEYFMANTYDHRWQQYRKKKKNGGQLLSTIKAIGKCLLVFTKYLNLADV